MPKSITVVGRFCSAVLRKSTGFATTSCSETAKAGVCNHQLSCFIAAGKWGDDGVLSSSFCINGDSIFGELAHLRFTSFGYLLGKRRSTKTQSRWGRWVSILHGGEMRSMLYSTVFSRAAWLWCFCLFISYAQINIIRENWSCENSRHIL